MSTRHGHRLCGLLIALVVSGCAQRAQPEWQDPAEAALEAYYGAAACQPDPTQGLAIAKGVLAKEPDNRKSQLLHAYVIERTGRPIQAWELYTSLADGDFHEVTSLSCDGNLIYSGSVSDVALFRATWLAQSLKAQGVDLTPMPKTTQTTPPMQHENKSAVVLMPPSFAENTPTVTPKNVAKLPLEKRIPAKTKPIERVFVHLASYKGPKALERGWQQISSRHSALLKPKDKATRSVKLKDRKNPMLRLGVYADDKAAAQTLCKSLKAKRQYCAVVK